MLPRPFRIACLCALPFFALAWLLMAPPVGAINPQVLAAPAAPDKLLVMDGSFVHDVGRLQCNITNWGLIGSHPGVSVPYSLAPSCRWPAADSPEYLWAAGLWVGANLLGERHVSTGQYLAELRPTLDPVDTMYRSAMGAAGGHRYPEPLPDDDGDGLEDEDPLNGVDDDGDGLIDEDFAAIGEQYFHARMIDYTAEAQAAYPDHDPLGIEVVQQTFQWSDPWLQDAIGLDFTIRNAGVTTLNDVYVGFFMDSDIGPRSVSQRGMDDKAGYWEGSVAAQNGQAYPVRAGYMFDNTPALDGDTPGYLGVALLDHTTDPAGLLAPATVGVRAFQIMNAMVSFDLGGDPTNDSERYQLLSESMRDPNVTTGHEGDYRVLISSGPFPSLAPGQEISYRVALVIGAGLTAMRSVGAEAMRLYEGVAFNRDGDPNTGPDGRELRVHWLRPQDVPVAATWGRLHACSAVGGLRLDWETNLDDVAGLALWRRAGADAAATERRWTADELGQLRAGDDGAGGTLVDAEPAAWPRTYRLLQSAAHGAWSGDETVLDEVTLAGPPAVPLRLSVRPNPANPRVVLQFGVPEAGPVRLTIHDVRGRLVRTLLAAERSAGEDEAVWDGLDDAGRPAPSGAYQAQLRCGTSQVNQQVTLVR